MRILLCMLIILGAHQTHAQPQPFVIRVGMGKVSEIIFPQNIAKVIKGGAADSIMVEAIDRSLYVMPKAQPLSDIFVTTVSGDSYPLNLVVSANPDISFEINTAVGKDTAQTAHHGNVMAVMKDVLMGRPPTDGMLLKSAQGQEFFRNGQIQMTVQLAYDLPDLTAYVLEARNVTGQDAVVPIEQMNVPRLLAVASDCDRIAPQGQLEDKTSVYMVVGK